MSTDRATIAGITHHTAHLDGADLHYVSAGSAGTPIVLVHGFPETWWAFHEVIPSLAEEHRVFAVDLRGFGDSSAADVDHDSETAAIDLKQFVEHLGVGPVHLTSQDIAGAAAFRMAATHPDLVRSFTAIEMGLGGFGLEDLADVTRGGSWHIGVMAAPGVPEMLLKGREREFLGDWAFPGMIAVAGAVGPDDIDEFARTYSRADGWHGAAGLYRSMLSEGEALRSLAARRPLAMPVLAVGAGGGPFTLRTVERIAVGRIDSVHLDGVGHYVALEAPTALARAILDFLRDADSA
ncbi:pimeloyl-ACP methyl ester carboxylesterase [Diaminobutyricimonas aerilata]|uniref:Pimeloyl-ACP methyl ester carboxylesterase n=1 Tax=Diaminobutyricimonas aerilata TaxID=1162967 RepID=A0A2M9CL73_9MICO|nr:alpha/beta hydrolase [Diaminobutyricimonas aerilata]PJJ72647.1 pimeloyl-ACP methyl ester carboxylesterase [Diaminobutyricimonas aerilata]